MADRFWTRTRKVQLGKACVFLMLCAFILAGITHFLTPAYTERDGIRGLYEQPNNSVEVAFMGASTFLCNIAPDRLYEQCGIPSYVVATSNQPFLSTYYLYKDVLQRQGGSLRVVMIDVTPLVKESEGFNSSSNAQKVLTFMRPSAVSLEYAWRLSREYSDVRFSEALFPMLKFHSRWNDISDYDMEHLLPVEQGIFGHGQLVFRKSFISNATEGRAGKYTAKNITNITDSREVEDGKLEGLWNDDVEYLEKIIESCHDRSIDVVLMKTPAAKWSDIEHDSTSLFAERHGVVFLDMNNADIWAETGLSYDDDYRDDKHTNIAGSVKTTDYIGAYLHDSYDIGGSTGELGKCGFSDADIQRFHECVQDMKLSYCRDMGEYLKMLGDERYTVFVSAYSKSTQGFDEGIIKDISATRFRELTKIESGLPYVGVWDKGSCVSFANDEKGSKVKTQGVFRDGSVNLEKTSMQHGAVLDDRFLLTSEYDGDSASCVITIDDDEVLSASGGLALAVYDKKSGYLIDTAVFDLGADGCERLSAVGGGE